MSPDAFYKLFQSVLEVHGSWPARSGDADPDRAGRERGASAKARTT